MIEEKMIAIAMLMLIFSIGMSVILFLIFARWIIPKIVRARVRNKSDWIIHQYCGGSGYISFIGHDTIMCGCWGVGYIKKGKTVINV